MVSWWRRAWPAGGRTVFGSGWACLTSSGPTARSRQLACSVGGAGEAERCRVENGSHVNGRAKAGDAGQQSEEQNGAHFRPLLPGWRLNRALTIGDENVYIVYIQEMAVGGNPAPGVQIGQFAGAAPALGSWG